MIERFSRIKIYSEIRPFQMVAFIFGKRLKII